MTLRTAIPAIAFIVAAAAPCAAQTHAHSDNEAVVRALFDEAWSAGRFDTLDRLIAPDLQFHFRGRAMPMTTQGFQGMVGMWRTAFPDLQFSLHDVVSSGDRVAARFTFTGTHRAPLFGVEPTGRTVTVSLMAFFRLADGRIVEMWEDYDEHGMRQQLTRPAND